MWSRKKCADTKGDVHVETNGCSCTDAKVAAEILVPDHLLLARRVTGRVNGGVGDTKSASTPHWDTGTSHTAGSRTGPRDRHCQESSSSRTDRGVMVRAAATNLDNAASFSSVKLSDTPVATSK